MTSLYLGNCLEVLPTFKQGSIDMVLTSPPYDNLRTYNDSSTWNFEVFQSVARELHRVLKDGGIMVWVVSDSTKNYGKSLTSFKQAIYFNDIGFKVVDVMIWRKPGFTDVASIKYRYPNVFEYMFVLAKGKPSTFNPIKDRKNIHGGSALNGTRRQVNGTTKDLWSAGKVLDEYGIRFNVWDMSHANKGKEKTGHPAQFPEELATGHILSWSNENDTVLDPFMGSGTTGVVCKQFNRNFIGIEIDASYFNMAENRINLYNIEVL